MGGARPGLIWAKVRKKGEKKGNAGDERLFLQSDGKGVEYAENCYTLQAVIPP
jgi:hypothetical protein